MEWWLHSTWSWWQFCVSWIFSQTAKIHMPVRPNSTTADAEITPTSEWTSTCTRKDKTLKSALWYEHRHMHSLPTSPVTTHQSIQNSFKCKTQFTKSQVCLNYCYNVKTNHLFVSQCPRFGAYLYSVDIHHGYLLRTLVTISRVTYFYSAGPHGETALVKINTVQKQGVEFEEKQTNKQTNKKKRKNLKNNKNKKRTDREGRN